MSHKVTLLEIKDPAEATAILTCLKESNFHFTAFQYVKKHITVTFSNRYNVSAANSAAAEMVISARGMSYMYQQLHQTTGADSYRVRWEIDVEGADDTNDAAREAQEMMQGQLYPVFDVIAPDGTVTRVDTEKLTEDL